MFGIHPRFVELVPILTQSEDWALSDARGAVVSLLVPILTQSEDWALSSVQ